LFDDNTQELVEILAIIHGLSDAVVVVVVVAVVVVIIIIIIIIIITAMDGEIDSEIKCYANA